MTKNQTGVIVSIVMNVLFTYVYYVLHMPKAKSAQF